MELVPLLGTHLIYYIPPVLVLFVLLHVCGVYKMISRIRGFRRLELKEQYSEEKVEEGVRLMARGIYDDMMI